MAHQDAIVSNLKEDQPPVYPSNDKPPDYRDVCPRKTVSPPSVDIPPPVDIPPSVDIPLPDNTPTFHIPLMITNDTGTSPAVYSSNTTITVTRYPPENIVVTQPPTYNSNLYQSQEQDKTFSCYDVLWKILIVFSVIAAIVAPPIGVFACLYAYFGYDSTDKEERKKFAIIAILLCVVVYVAVIIIVVTLPLTL